MTRIFESSENGGFHPEVPGRSGAIRALLDDDGTVLEVVPYGSLLSVESTVTSSNAETITETIHVAGEQQAVEPPAQEEVPVQEEEE